MRNTPSSTLWLATVYLVLGARALPRPHPAATYQVVDVGGPTSSPSASAEIIYETVAITKSSTPKTVTEAPVTVTVTPTISAVASAPLSSSVAASSTSPTAIQESAEKPASYSTAIVKSPLPTISLPTSTWSAPALTTTSQAVYVPETTATTWTSASPFVATSVAAYSPPNTSSQAEPIIPTEAPAFIPPMSIWFPTPTTAIHTVFETVFVAPPTYSHPAPAKSAFPTFIVPWNGTHHQGKATLSASQGHSFGSSLTMAAPTGAPIDLYLAA